MFNGLRGTEIVSGVAQRKGSRVRGGGSARDDVVRALRNAVERFLQFLRVSLENV